MPYYVPQARFGYKYGGGQLVDGLEKDGLLDVYDQCSMGVFADRTARQYDISRQAQDDYTVGTYERAAEATTNGRFSEEIIPVEIPQKKGGSLAVTEDEEYKKVIFEKIPALRPVFEKDGTVTAASSSPINDGASALVLMTRKKADQLGLKPLARILGFADAEQEPAWFTTAPTLAVPRALKFAGVNPANVDLFEVNEAFAVVPLAFARVLGVPLQKLNVNGGAVALGHPLGASGARITTTLLHALAQRGGRIGAAGICNGGGGASAIVLENLIM